MQGKIRFAWFAFTASAVAVACGTENNPLADDSADAGSAGTTSSGGTDSAGNGGAGTTSSGGTSSAGTTGTAGRAGNNAAGDTNGSGGNTTAGTSNAGSAPRAGGAGTANAGTGGSNSAGSGNAGTGATAGQAPSTGCDASEWPASDKYTLMVDDVAREYIVAIPEDYDPSQAHRLVFAFHGLTGTAEQIAGGFGGGYYGLETRIGSSSILVAPQGLAPEDEPDQFGWPNEDGRDIAFVRAMITSFTESYCIDENRIFSVGMSYGGIMSNTIGCQMSDTFRAIAPIAGALFGRGNSCEGPPIAAWMAHGTADETVEFTQGEAARDIFLEKNHCDATLDPTPVEPEGCVSYQGCDAGAPVIWCVHDGGHIVPDYTGEAVSEFFSSF